MPFSKQKLADYFILCARVLLAWTFLSYGWGKLNGNQFGLTAEQLNQPVKDISMFKLSWYLFDQQPFRAFIGISQIVAGLLLLYNRTLLIGALLSIPILANILVIDITYLKMPGFYWRLSYYLFLDFLILWYYRDRVQQAFINLFSGITTRFKYPLWAYLILPVMAIVLELLGILPRLLTNLILHPTETLEALGKLPEYLAEIIKKISR